MNNLLIFCRDPAAAVQIIGLMDRSCDHTIAGALACAFGVDAGAISGLLSTAQLRAKEPGLSILRAAGVPAEPWREPAPAPTPDARIAALRDFMRQSAIGAVLTGTSDLDEDTDWCLWQAAERESWPSAALVDRSENLDARFAKANNSRALPGTIFVPDERTHAACLAWGMPLQRVAIVGDLRAAYVRRLSESLPADTRAAVRASWRVDETDFVLLFASEAGRESATFGRNLDFDEIAALECLLVWTATDNFRAHVPPQRHPVIVVRPHPRDLPGKYAEHAARGVRLDSAVHSSVAAIAGADLVVGITSSLLDEAVMAGRPAACLRPAVFRQPLKPA